MRRLRKNWERVWASPNTATKSKSSIFDNSSKSCDISFINAVNVLLKQNANSTNTGGTRVNGTLTQEKIQKTRDALNQIKNSSSTVPVSPETQAILKNLDLEKIMEELEEKKGESYVI